MQIPAELEPEQLATGETTVRIGNRRYLAFVEDDLLIVRGVMNKGRTFPEPNPALYIVRIDASARNCELSAAQLSQFPAPQAADAQP